MEKDLHLEKEDNLEDILLTHEELKKVTKSTLNELLLNDFTLRDLPQDVTLGEVEAQLAVLHGQSMTVYITREGISEIPVIVKQSNSTVADLKRAFQRAMVLKLRREGDNSKISWKHFWKVHLLSCDGTILDSSSKFLKFYGVSNKSRLKFISKIKEKNAYPSGKR